MSDQTIDSFLSFSHTAITNGKENPEILEMLTAYGYNEDTMLIGKQLLETAQYLQTKKVKEFSEQVQASAELEMARASANLLYMRYLKISRVAFNDHAGYMQALMLNGRRKRSLSGWIGQAKSFYENAIAEQRVQDGLAKYNITLEKLNEGHQSVKDVEKKRAVQLKEMGEAQQATLDRDRAFDELDEWMSNFISIAKIALEEKSQYLEALGVVVPA